MFFLTKMVGINPEKLELSLDLPSRLAISTANSAQFCSKRTELAVLIEIVVTAIFMHNILFTPGVLNFKYSFSNRFHEF